MFFSTFSVFGIASEFLYWIFGLLSTRRFTILFGKLSIIVNLEVKNERDNVLTSRNFNEEFSYDVQSDKFNMSQYEDNIINNLNNKISNDIIFLLGTIE